MTSKKIVQLNDGIKRISKAATQCSMEGSMYGKCIVHHLYDIQKDMCAKEFLMFKQCFQRQMKLTL
ncbi:hypothetical protein HMI54_007844 [Coelomomyces lativittatus]|nr:hypothetical protein HMI54_007844 [Coelomomyces lativittatus]